MVSKLLRRTHLYLALFLTPWVLMYTLSTAAMNHRDVFQRMHGKGPPPFETVSDGVYAGTFPAGTPAAEMARQLLSGLHLDGAHTVGKPAADGTVVIQRLDAVAPYRITYSPSGNRLRVERMTFRANHWLERMHRRRGYQHPYAIEDTWAFSVDLFVAAMLFWILSGIWMWWELKITRMTGAACLACGLALFLLFLVRI